MKIRFAVSTGCDFGQFVVTAETDEERALLYTFMRAQQYGYEFCLHGYGGLMEHQGHDSFNFGWRKPSKR